MGNADSEGIEGLLANVNAGRPRAIERLTEAVYQQLRAMADAHLRRRFGRAAESLTWQPTFLVNETLLRIIKRPREFDNEGHFFAIATKVMRGLLVDYCRKRSAMKRGGDRVRIELSPDLEAFEAKDGERHQLESLFEALDRLAILDARKARVVQMRILWGLTNEETAAALDVSRATVERDWRFARAWLKRELASREEAAED